MFPKGAPTRNLVFALAVVIGIATLLRMFVFLTRGDLWEDEAGLALNVVPQSWADIGRPFIFRQVCPFGFMYLAKLVTLVAGPSEFALRFVPLIAGLTVVPVVAGLAGRVYGWPAALTAAAFATCAPRFVWYSAEFKPYIVDAALGGALLLLGTHVAVHRPTPHRDWLILGVAGAVALWISLPAIFVVGGVGVALAASARLSSARTWAGLIAIAALWIVSAAIHIWLLNAGAEAHGQTSFMTSRWSNYFAPFPPDSLADVRWYVGKLIYAFDDPLGFGPVQAWLDPNSARWVVRPPIQLPARLVALFAFVVGLIILRLRQRAFLVAVAGQLSLVLIASAIERYPIQGRMIMFAAPGLLTIVAVGVAWLTRHPRMTIRVVGAISVLILAYYPALNVAGLVTQERSGREFHALVGDVKTHFRPQDQIYVGADLRWQFTYYAGIEAFAPLVTEGIQFAGDGFELGQPTKTSQVLSTLDNAQRAWILVPTFVPKAGVSLDRYVAAAMNRTHRRTGEWRSRGSVAYLYSPR